jgi:hypothetical protein
MLFSSASCERLTEYRLPIGITESVQESTRISEKSANKKEVFVKAPLLY